jgi:hypothetical protein
MVSSPMMLALSLACACLGSQPQAPEGFGASVASAGDLDGDGCPDLIVGDASRREPRPCRGAVWVLSGKEGHVLHEFHASPDPAESTPYFGCAVAAAGDLDGDGCGDVLVGDCGREPLYSSADNEPVASRSRASLGYVRGLSGRDGHLLLEHKGTEPGFGRAITSIGDLDGDGVGDAIVTSRSCAQILSGKDGRLVRTISPKDAPGRSASGLNHTSVAAIGDVDHDGLADVLFAWSGAWRGALVQSGGSGKLLYELSRAGEADCSDYGWASLGIGDVDRDGTPDLAITCLDYQVRVHSGKDGSLLRAIRDARPGGYMEGFGASMAVLGDLDGDQVPDFAVGCEEYIDSGDQYYAAVYSGRSGELLHLIDTAPNFVVVAAAGDVDGDGCGDLLLANWEIGVVRVLSGKTWKILATRSRPAARSTTK